MSNMFLPWRSDSELAMVRDWFFPQQMPNSPYTAPASDMRREAVDRVTAWTFRDADTPHFVIATAGLTDAVLHDEITNRRTYITDSGLQGIYAHAFCRFVNGLVDREVAKSSAVALRAVVGENISDGKTTPTARGESSMFAHAAKIELPILFVELRHRITHGKMPTLDYQRRMTEQALDWLYVKWWKQNARGDPGTALRALALQKAEEEERKRHRQQQAGNDAERTSSKRALEVAVEDRNQGCGEEVAGDTVNGSPVKKSRQRLEA